jgi:hypothetical protein
MGDDDLFHTTLHGTLYYVNHTSNTGTEVAYVVSGGSLRLEMKGYCLEDIEKQSLITSCDVLFIEDDSPTELAIIEGEYPPTEDN